MSDAIEVTVRIDADSLKKTLLPVLLFVGMVGIGAGAVQLTADQIDLSGGDILQLSDINPTSGDSLTLGGDLDLDSNTLKGIGSTMCGAEKVIMGDGNCEAVSSTLSDTLSDGNSAGSNDIDMNGQDVLNINWLSGDSGPIDFSNDIDMEGDNIRLNGGYLSNDGNDEGISVDNSGNVDVSGHLDMNQNDISNVDNFNSGQFHQNTLHYGTGEGGSGDNQYYRVEIARITTSNADGGGGSDWFAGGPVIFRVDTHYYEDGGMTRALFSGGRYSDARMHYLETAGERSPRIYIGDWVDTGENSVSSGRDLQYWPVYVDLWDYGQFKVQVSHGREVVNTLDDDGEIKYTSNYEPISSSEFSTFNMSLDRIDPIDMHNNQIKNADVQSEGWNTPNLDNNWQCYDSPGNGWGCPQYYKTADGVVHLRGLVESGDSNDAQIFSLPSGYRPQHKTLHGAMSDNNGAPCRVNIDSQGSVDPHGGTGCDTNWISLNSISFRADD